MKKLKIKAYLKPHCGWSKGVRQVMGKYRLEFEEIDIVNYRENYAEMVERSGQHLSPCVEVEGVMLADVSGEEVERYLLSRNLVEARSGDGGCGEISRGCTDKAQSEGARSQTTIRFNRG